jgi:hypothetical protein
LKPSAFRRSDPSDMRGLEGDACVAEIKNSGTFSN